MRLLVILTVWMFAVACSLEYNSLNGVAAKMHVDFMNLNPEPVTHIRFRVQARLSTFAVMDLGTFAPNLRIHHDLDPPMTSVAVVRGVRIANFKRGWTLLRYRREYAEQRVHLGLTALVRK